MNLISKKKNINKSHLNLSLVDSVVSGKADSNSGAAINIYALDNST